MSRRMTMNKQKNKQITMSAIFAALVFLATLTGAVAPIGGGAYVHIGDAMIYLAALVLPLPYAVCASAIGAGLADLMLGSAIYIIPTVIVKSLLVVAAKGVSKLSSKSVIKDILVCLTGVVTVAGYYVAEVVLLLISGSEFTVALSVGAANSILFNTIHALASAAVYMILSGAVRSFMDKRKNAPAETDASDDSSSEDITE